jgi:hypothetical protein
MLLSQRQYTLEILERAGMTGCKTCATPADTQSKLSSSGEPVSDPTLYRSLVGALQYLTFTRPDITYAVQQVCLHMHDPREPHLAAAKRILRYLQGTPDLGLFIDRASSPTTLTIYTDADWAGCPETRRSTSGFAVFLGTSLVSWSSKRQHTVSRSSAEAEYRAIANGVAEASWLRQLLQELGQPLQQATLVYCDNVSAVYLSTNPVQHQRTKHIEIDLHFVHERVAAGAVRVLHVPTSSQFADIFTKGLPSTVFVEFRSSMNVWPADVPTAGGGGGVRQPLLVGYQLLWKPIPGYQSCGCLPDYPDPISISWVYLWLYIVTCTADLNQAVYSTKLSRLHGIKEGYVPSLAHPPLPSSSHGRRRSQRRRHRRSSRRQRPTFC